MMGEGFVICSSIPPFHAKSTRISPKQYALGPYFEKSDSMQTLADREASPTIPEISLPSIEA